MKAIEELVAYEDEEEVAQQNTLKLRQQEEAICKEIEYAYTYFLDEKRYFAYSARLRINPLQVI